MIASIIFGCPNNIGSQRFKTFVAGNLSKKEALKFWNECALTRCHIGPPSFEEAVGVCGGNMFMLEKYIQQCGMMEGKLPPESFEPVMNEESRLMRA